MKAELGFQKVQSPVTIRFPADWEGGETTVEEKAQQALQFGDLQCLRGPTPGRKVRTEQGGVRRGPLSADPAEVWNHSHVSRWGQ